MKYLKILLILHLLAITACGLGEKEKNIQTLILGTNPTYAPYEYIDRSGEFAGFDIDVAKALAEKLGKKLIIKQTEFDALILALKQEKIDLIISGMSITSSRQKEITMLPYQGEPIHSLSLAFWDKLPENIHSFEDIKNSHKKVVAVQMGTFQNDYLNGIEGIQVRALEGNSELIMDIKYGKSAAALFEPHVALAMKKKFPELKFINIPLNENEWVLGNGVGIKKENTLLKESVSQALKEIKEEGTIAKLELKWFGDNPL